MGKYMDLGEIERRLLAFAKDRDWHDVEFEYTEDRAGSCIITLVITLYCDADPDAGLNAGRAIYRFVLIPQYAEVSGYPTGYQTIVDGKLDRGMLEPIDEDDDPEFVKELGELAAKEIFNYEYVR